MFHQSLVNALSNHIDQTELSKEEVKQKRLEKCRQKGK